MKNQLIQRIAILFLLAIAFSLNSYADNGNCKGQHASQDVFITINNDNRINENSVIQVKLEFTASSIISSLNISDSEKPSELNPFEDKVPYERTGQSKDGKVDVDIIIRGSDLSIYRDPTSTNEHIKINILTLDFITVDNISGVYETEGTNSNDNFAYRIVSAEITSEIEGNQTVTNAEGIVSMGLSNIKYQSLERSQESVAGTVTSNDITLYPNPVRNSSFRIKSELEIGDVRTLSIFNAVGGLVHQETLRNVIISNHQINLPHLPSGIYFLNLDTTKGQIVKKFNLIN